jgi:hypothetical protein
MTLKDIPLIRLQTQQISSTRFKKPKEIVAWMGAIQAQDFSMAKWAIGLRLPGSTDKEIETAINKGEVIRTHLLRPTWHFVTRENIRWMLGLTAPRIKSSMRARDKQLGLTPKIFSISNGIIEKILGDKKYSTRDEIMLEIKKAKISTGEFRSGHIMLNAELEGIVCSGPLKNKKQTYSLLAERVPKGNDYIKDEALAKLAEIYFRSHGPATLQDFAWWSGLSAPDARQALENIKRDLIAETIESKTYWLPKSFSFKKDQDLSIYLLPAYDEFMVSYRDRSASIALKHHRSMISSNGIFKPSIVLNGRITGIWKRILKNEKIAIEADFFTKKDKLNKDILKKLIKNYSDFLGKEVHAK